MKLKVYISNNFVPYKNIAAEEYLMDLTERNTAIMYLWQNYNTVVIGRNQNAWQECRVEELKADGGYTARRLSGGGAVFHDLGNLNFTFIEKCEDYDLDKHLQVIYNAVKSFGINASFSGRNDILAEGKKFSGNAFYDNKKSKYHHGTLLISGDMQMLSKYLTPSKEKLSAKGVKSVESRVINLAELNAKITPDTMKEALIKSAKEIYKDGFELHNITELEGIELSKREAFFASDDWLYGKLSEFNKEFRADIEGAHLTIRLLVSDGVIKEACVYSDGMDTEVSGVIKNALSGCGFVKNSMVSGLKEAGIKEEDIISIVTAMAE